MKSKGLNLTIETDDAIFPTVKNIGSLGMEIIDTPQDTLLNTRSEEAPLNEEDASSDKKSSLTTAEDIDIESGLEGEEGSSKVEKASDRNSNDNRTSNQLIQTLKNLYGEGLTIVQQDEEGNEIDIPVDEVDMTTELFHEILDQQKKAEIEEATKDKISIAGTSDFVKNLIEIDKNGGDITTLLRMRDAYINPLDQLDLATKQGQREAVALLERANGVKEEYISLKVKDLESRGLLEEKAYEADELLRKEVEAQAEQQKANMKERKEKLVADLQVYKKNVKSQFKEKFELKETEIAKLLDIGMKQDENGRYELDNLYKDFRNTPEKAADLILFLSDKEEYDRQVSNKKVVSETLKNANRIRVKTVSPSVETVSKNRNNDEEIIIPSKFETK